MLTNVSRVESGVSWGVQEDINAAKICPEENNLATDGFQRNIKEQA